MGCMASPGWKCYFQNLEQQFWESKLHEQVAHIPMLAVTAIRELLPWVRPMASWKFLKSTDKESKHWFIHERSQLWINNKKIWHIPSTHPRMTLKDSGKYRSLKKECRQISKQWRWLCMVVRTWGRDSLEHQSQRSLENINGLMRVSKRTQILILPVKVLTFPRQYVLHQAT